MIDDIDHTMCRALFSVSAKVISALTDREFDDIAKCFDKLAQLRHEHEELVQSKADDDTRFQMEVEQLKATISALAAKLLEKENKCASLEATRGSNDVWFEELNGANKRIAALEQQLASVRESRQRLEDEIGPRKANDASNRRNSSERCSLLRRRMRA